MHGDELPLETIPVRCFPPPSNAVYDRALKEHFIERSQDGEREERGMQRLKIMVSTEGWFREVRGDRRENWRVGERKMSDEDIGEIGETEAQQCGQLKEKSHAKHAGEPDGTGFSKLIPKNNLIKGEKLAQSINFRRPTCITTAPGVSCPILPADEQRQDFIVDINTHGSQLALYSICNKRHTPPGPPITLADRDTCGSLLPKWFPAHLVARPWDAYRALINELVALEEQKDKGDAARVLGRPRWDSEWQEASPEWVAAGRKEGWWRCRNDADAPEAERNCRVCHRERVEEERRRTLREEEEMRKERKRMLQGFIDRQARMFGEVDRDVALARVQLESMDLIMRSGGGKKGVGEALGEGLETTDKNIEEILGSKTRGQTEESSTSGSDSEDSEPDTSEESPGEKSFFF